MDATACRSSGSDETAAALRASTVQFGLAADATRSRLCSDSTPEAATSGGQLLLPRARTRTTRLASRASIATTSGGHDGLDAAQARTPRSGSCASFVTQRGGQQGRETAARLTALWVSWTSRTNPAGGVHRCIAAAIRTSWLSSLAKISVVSAGNMSRCATTIRTAGSVSTASIDRITGPLVAAAAASRRVCVSATATPTGRSLNAPRWVCAATAMPAPVSLRCVPIAAMVARSLEPLGAPSPAPVRVAGERWPQRRFSRRPNIPPLRPLGLSCLAGCFDVAVGSEPPPTRGVFAFERASAAGGVFASAGASAAGGVFASAGASAAGGVSASAGASAAGGVSASVSSESLHAGTSIASPSRCGGRLCFRIVGVAPCGNLDRWPFRSGQRWDIPDNLVRVVVISPLATLGDSLADARLVWLVHVAQLSRYDNAESSPHVGALRETVRVDRESSSILLSRQSNHPIQGARPR